MYMWDFYLLNQRQYFLTKTENALGRKYNIFKNILERQWLNITQNNTIIKNIVILNNKL